jgi:ribosomal protein L34E
LVKELSKEWMGLQDTLRTMKCTGGPTLAEMDEVVQKFPNDGSKENSLIREAKLKVYEGYPCVSCGSYTVDNQRCETCGTSQFQKPVSPPAPLQKPTREAHAKNPTASKAQCDHCGAAVQGVWAKPWEIRRTKDTPKTQCPEPFPPMTRTFCSTPCRNDWVLRNVGGGQDVDIQGGPAGHFILVRNGHTPPMLKENTTHMKCCYQNLACNRTPVVRKYQRHSEPVVPVLVCEEHLPHWVAHNHAHLLPDGVYRFEADFKSLIISPVTGEVFPAYGPCEYFLPTRPKMCGAQFSEAQLVKAELESEHVYLCKAHIPVWTKENRMHQVDGRWVKYLQCDYDDRCFEIAVRRDVVGHEPDIDHENVCDQHIGEWAKESDLEYRSFTGKWHDKYPCVYAECKVDKYVPGRVLQTKIGEWTEERVCDGHLELWAKQNGLRLGNNRWNRWIPQEQFCLRCATDDLRRTDHRKIERVHGQIENAYICNSCVGDYCETERISYDPSSGHYRPVVNNVIETFKQAKETPMTPMSQQQPDPSRMKVCSPPQSIQGPVQGYQVPPTFQERFKAELVMSGQLIAAGAIRNTVKNAYCVAVDKTEKPPPSVKILRDLLDTELGEVALDAILGFTIPLIPNLDPRFEDLATGLRINAMTKLGTHVIAAFQEPIFDAIRGIDLDKFIPKPKGDSTPAASGTPALGAVSTGIPVKDKLVETYNAQHAQPARQNIHADAQATR